MVPHYFLIVAPKAPDSIHALAEQPIGGTTRQVARSAALGDDPLEAHAARLAEHRFAVVLEMRIEAHDICRLAQHVGERALAVLDLVAAQIEAVHLEQVEDIEFDVAVLRSLAQAAERSLAVLVAADELAVDDAGLDREQPDRVDDVWKAVGPIPAPLAIEPHSVAVAPRHQPLSRMLDLVQPLLARGRLERHTRQARLDEGERNGR